MLAHPLLRKKTFSETFKILASILAFCIHHFLFNPLLHSFPVSVCRAHQLLSNFSMACFKTGNSWNDNTSSGLNIQAILNVSILYHFLVIDRNSIFKFQPKPIPKPKLWLKLWPKPKLYENFQKVLFWPYFSPNYTDQRKWATL